MNNQLNLQFKINANSTNPATTMKVSASLMLYPMYALETDIFNIFTDLVSKDTEMVRQFLFNNSISVYTDTVVLENTHVLPHPELQMIRRDLTICMTTRDIAKKLHQGYVSSSSVAKALGDYHASKSQRSDPIFLMKTITEAQECVTELKKLIGGYISERLIPVGFAKSAKNVMSKNHYNRLWWPKELSPYWNKEAYASWKHPLKDGLYKGATIFNPLYMQSYGSEGNKQNYRTSFL